MTPEELKQKEIADNEKAEQLEAEKALEAARALAKDQAEKAADVAKSTKAKAKVKKTMKDLRSTDIVEITFKVPTFEDEDGESKVEKTSSAQHLPFAFWQNLAKDNNGNPMYGNLRGAKITGYLEDNEVINF
jgi:hypothetical protein